MTTSGVNGAEEFRRAVSRAAPALRRPLPWIGHDDPWAVLVSEVMLQQTQAARVVEPWARFMSRFPSPADCAAASLADVLREWSGLGFPRRARALHTAARQIRDVFGGQVPDQVDQLRTLAGVGEYTANAVATFAFGRRVAVVDTNVGRILARAVANRTLSVGEARDLARRVLGGTDAARFNQAMIDLGALHCRAVPKCDQCPVRRVCRWHREGGEDPAPKSGGVSRPQGRFKGSNRELRGVVLRELREGPKEITQLRQTLSFDDDARLDIVLTSLVDDGLIFWGGDIGLIGD